MLVKVAAGCVCFVAWMWVVSLCYTTDQGEIQRACGEAGVQQIVDTWATPQIPGITTVVCRDGRVVEVG